MSIQFISDKAMRKKSDVVITVLKTGNRSSVHGNVCTATGDLAHVCYFDCVIVSPAYYSYSFKEDSSIYDTAEEFIRGCYCTMLLQIADYACGSAELPLIWFPEINLTQEKIIHIASEVVLDFLDYYDMDIQICLPHDRLRILDNEHLHNLREIVHTRYVPSAPIQMPKANLTETQKLIEKMLLDGDATGTSELVRLNSLDELMSRKDKPFATHLFRMIDSRGMTDAEVYKGALLDRKLFSKIRNSNNYTPRKGTILALAISMRLTLDETQDLLQSAGYALSDSSEMDIIVGYFIDHNIFDIFKVNEALGSFGLKGLGNTSD